MRQTKMQKEKIALLAVWGEPASSQVIDAFVRMGLQIDAVYFDSKTATEKDIAIWQERTNGALPDIPLSAFAGLRIPFFFVDSHNSSTTQDLLVERGTTLLVNAVTPRILNQNILDAPKRGVLNVHPGLLPQFRGCTCVEWAVFLDEPIGNTAHFMSKEIDEGAVVIQEALTVTKSDSYSAVRTKVYENGFRLLAASAKKILCEDIFPSDLKPQSEGRYFDVIPEDKFRIVQEKLQDGIYKYQL